MKLRYSPTSPYVRKVIVTAMETGLDDRIERQPTNPWDPGTDLPGDNPLGKVPALLTDDGQTLYDSPVICEYLDSLGAGRLFPASGPERWRALQQQALADGILDASILAMLESRRRPQEYCWNDWVDRQKSSVARSVDALEHEVSSFGDQLTIGQIAAGCALGYLDFRFAEDDWRRDHPILAAWYEGFAARPAMTATIPKDPT